jgi:dTDP-4-dehydrorhamnose 3,5-epimerase
MNKYKKSKIFNDVKIFETRPFRDFRGNYVESFNSDFFNQENDIEFIQDDFSTSQKNVLRGLHGDSETWKLVSCPFGKIYLVVADMRENSSTFLQWEAFTLSPEAPQFILIPPGFANGHLVLSEIGVFHYKQSTNYGTKQFTVKYNDTRLNIFWPNIPFIQSERDIP